MRAWITKYALTKGVIEVECELIEPDVIRYSSAGYTVYAHKGEWAYTKYEALKKADLMRDRKIASLHKKLDKLVYMTIKVKELS